MYTVPKAALVAILGLVPASACLAQWSSDASQNLAIADRSSEQTQAKIVATSDGGCYISWFDNHTGSYDVYLQRLDAQGVAQWPHNGILIADRSFSSTQDYGLAVDGDDNAIIAYRDDRQGGVQIGVNKISPDGTLLWGPTGVLVTNTTDFIGNPSVVATSDGNYIVGWTQEIGYQLQKLNSSGVPQWAAGGIGETPATGSYMLSDLVASDNGSVIVLWVRPIGNFLSNKHLYTQKYDASGNMLWNDGMPVIVFDASSVQNGYFPLMESDGNGGAVYAWYEIGGTRNAYVQRVNSAGTEVFVHNGVAVSTNTNGIMRLAPSIAFDPAHDDIYAFWAETDSVFQSQYAVYGQRIDAAGNRAWTDTGKQIIAPSGNQPSFVSCVLTDNGAMTFGIDRSGNALIFGAALDRHGEFTWSPAVLNPCTSMTGKSRLAATRSATGAALLAWRDSRADAGDIYAQNVNPDGTLGNQQQSTPGDVTGDGIVNVNDLLAVIAAWGPCPGRGSCDADIAPAGGDGQVNVDDLLMVIANWG